MRKTAILVGILSLLATTAWPLAYSAEPDPAVSIVRRGNSITEGRGERVLPDARSVQLGGPLGLAYDRGVARLAEDPYRSAAFLRSDFTFETDRVFVNYSGDISGRFIQIASRISTPEKMTPALLAEVFQDIDRYQQADGHFGRDVNWSEPLEPENSNARLLPIFWGNSRLLLGLLEANQTFDRPDLLEAAKRIGDFYITTADRFLDPDREAEYRSTGSYAAGYVTDYFPGIEGLVRLFQVTEDKRYLQQAERMAEFFKRFDTLPIDHSHGNLVTHYGLLSLYETTGKAEYLERPRNRWEEAVRGGYVWPMGGVGEKFRVSYGNDEGCSEADWLRLSLGLWRLTGQCRYLEMAERLLWNHYAMNRAPNGGYGHHEFLCDSEGPLLVKPQFTEAVWCCTFHGLLGLDTLKSYVITGSDQGVFVNFPVTASASIPAGNCIWPVTVAWRRQPGSWMCSIQMKSPDLSLTAPDVFLRLPAWADSATVSDVHGKRLELAAEDGYLRLPGRDAVEGKVEVSLAFSPRVENRRLAPVSLGSETVGRHRGITLWDGPHLLLANSDQPRPTLVASVGKDGRLRLARNPDQSCRLILVPGVDASEQDIAAAEQPATVSLSPWEEVRHDAPAAFVFDLITVPETSPPAE